MFCYIKREIQGKKGQYYQNLHLNLTWEYIKCVMNNLIIYSTYIKLAYHKTISDLCSLSLHLPESDAPAFQCVIAINIWPFNKYFEINLSQIITHITLNFLTLNVTQSFFHKMSSWTTICSFRLPLKQIKLPEIFLDDNISLNDTHSSFHCIKNTKAFQ